MSTSFFQDMLGSIAQRGRHLIDRTPARAARKGRKSPAHSADRIEDLAALLLSGRGEASGVALARQLLDLVPQCFGTPHDPPPSDSLHHT